MKQYVELLKKILVEGEERGDRTGTGTLSIFGGQLEFDLRDSFPLVTIKKTLWKSAFIEMLWFLRGEPNTRFLKMHGVPIWNDWADKDGNLGPIYGVQWRSWPGRKVWERVPAGESLNPQDGLDDSVVEEHYELTESPDIDQIAELIAGIKKNPEGRRHIVTAWNPADLHLMGLPPCHRDFQCYVSGGEYLDLMLAIRSWDTGLGAPFNIAQYAMLTHLIARATGLKPRKLKVNYGDAHIYLNHVEPIREMIETRQPLDCKPELVIKTDNVDIDRYKIEDFDVTGYASWPFIKLPIAV